MTSTLVFVDTFHWIAEINTRDEWHERCRAARALLRGRQFVTSENVLGEVLDFFSGYGPHIRLAAALTVEAVQNDPNISIVLQSHELFSAAVELYRKRPDKQYSLTDCSSMALMKNRGIQDVLTRDRHFEQEGFRTLIE